MTSSQSLSSEDASPRSQPLKPASPSLDVWIDFSCPWSYIAHHQLATGTPHGNFRVRAFQLNPDLPPEGIARAKYRLNKFGSKSESDRRDDRVAAVGRQTGTPIDFGKIDLTPNTRNAHRALKAVDAVGGDTVAFTEAVFAAYFGSGADIGEPEVLVSIASDSGINLNLADLDSSAGHEAALDADIDAAGAAGLTGVPYFADSTTHRPIPIAEAISQLTGDQS